MLYRAMREDVDGLPMLGRTARTLGIRLDVDIPVVAGLVQALTGGMSVAPDHPGNLHSLRRPPAYGGRGKDPVWFIVSDDLDADLTFRLDHPTHGVIEPARSMPIGEYELALERTRPVWKKLP